MLVNAATQYLCLDHFDPKSGWKQGTFSVHGTFSRPVPSVEYSEQPNSENENFGDRRLVVATIKSTNGIKGGSQTRIFSHLCNDFYWRKCEHKEKEVRERCSNNMKQQMPNTNKEGWTQKGKYGFYIRIWESSTYLYPLYMPLAIKILISSINTQVTRNYFKTSDIWTASWRCFCFFEATFTPPKQQFLFLVWIIIYLSNMKELRRFILS